MMNEIAKNMEALNKFSESEKLKQLDKLLNKFNVFDVYLTI